MKFDIVLINRFKFFIYLIFIGFFCFLNTTVKSEDNIKIKNNCSKNKFDSNFDDLNFIDIKFNKYKKWTANGLKILKSKKDKKAIQKEYKKGFKAKLLVKYKDRTECFFKARVRQSGDHFDHIDFINGNIIQSLDVHLEKNNIFGVTKFKLFIPITRRDENEVIITSLLSELGFIAPKTSLVKIRINGKIEKFIFQEKASKELIERSFFKDAPIYEGNENLVVETSKNKDGALFNKSLTFAKQINRSWIKSDLTKKISIEGLTRLNAVYFDNISKMTNKKIKYNQTTFNYMMLSNSDHEHSMNLNVYDAIIDAVDSGHALIPHNRKFYYDPHQKKFHPIFYDGAGGSYRRYLLEGWKSKIIKLDKEQINFKWGISKNSIKGASRAIKEIEKINIKKFSLELKSKGLNFNEKMVRDLFATISHNLSIISKFENSKNKDDYFINLNDYLAYASQLSVDFKISYTDNKNLFLCDNNFKYCKIFRLSKKEFSKLIKGDLKIEGKKILYLGNLFKQDLNIFKFDISKEKNSFISKNLKINDSNMNIYFTSGVKMNLNNSNKLLSITANNNDWIVIHNSVIGDLKILVEYNNESLLKKDYKKDRFNSSFLTGCLNIFDTKFNKSKLEVRNAQCEDALNIVKSVGIISDINISNSAFDSLDLDFSKIDINNININNSGNDCIDFSYGKHKINFIKAQNCGDKAVSAGEKTFVEIKSLHVSNAAIGTASKDGSKVTIKDSKIYKTDLCISAYKKKKEFSGGRINIHNLECYDYNKKIEIDNYSSIIVEESL